MYVKLIGEMVHIPCPYIQKEKVWIWKINRNGKVISQHKQFEIKYNEIEFSFHEQSHFRVMIDEFAVDVYFVDGNHKFG